ncbi:hypothetical protein TNCT_144911 [Trichonephila clavata]|uniref:Uncharacterized protein n=1 Tax=Trichonephila clavata TaxID=2740835 RepID=A0A8X6FM66_TRICU|nr:hypothetical protein TNCT_144911 [Trichonephila clavata]
MSRCVPTTKHPGIYTDVDPTLILYINNKKSDRIRIRNENNPLSGKIHLCLGLLGRGQKVFRTLTEVRTVFPPATRKFCHSTTFRSRTYPIQLRMTHAKWQELKPHQHGVSR